MEFIINDGPGSYQQPKTDTSKLIDKGPFFDRFGSIKMKILMSQDLAIKAILTDINNRLWIDLNLQEVSDTLAYIGTIIPELTTELQIQILNEPVKELENLGLRKLYFN